MAKPKESRNREFIAAWRDEGLSDKQLQERFGLSSGGIKALKSRLRKKDPSLYQKKPKPLNKVEKEIAKDSEGFIQFASKPAIQQTSKLAKYKKVTYYLDPKMVKIIKRLAVDRDMDISELVREALSQWISR